MKNLLRIMTLMAAAVPLTGMAATQSPTEGNADNASSG